MAEVSGDALSEPEAMQSLSTAASEPSPKVRWKPFPDTAIVFSGIPLRRVMPASRAAFMKQSMMVCAIGLGF